MAEKKTEKNGAPMGPGTSSIKDPEVYEALRREGASEEKARFSVVQPGVSSLG